MIINNSKKQRLLVSTELLTMPSCICRVEWLALKQA